MNHTIASFTLFKLTLCGADLYIPTYILYQDFQACEVPFTLMTLLEWNIRNIRICSLKGFPSSHMSELLVPFLDDIKSYRGNLTQNFFWLNKAKRSKILWHIAFHIQKRS